MYDRRLRDIVRYANGEKVSDFHIPTTVDDYRAVYRAYLHDPDLQDARARFPFVAMWDNHEFSWLGWQGFEKFGDDTRPTQTRKVAANQACRPQVSLSFSAASCATPSPKPRASTKRLRASTSNSTSADQSISHASLSFAGNVASASRNPLSAFQ